VTGQSDDRPTIEELVERSSLGTPEAKALRESVSPEAAAAVVRRSRELRD
jgi:hypothetical protein